MAKGRSGGGTPLNMRANLDIVQAKKNALDLIQTLKELRIASATSGTAGPVRNNSFATDMRSVTAFQTAQLQMQASLRDARLEVERIKSSVQQYKVELEQGRIAQQNARTTTEQLKIAEQELRIAFQEGRISQQQYNQQLAQGRTAQQQQIATLNASRIAQQNARTELAQLNLQQRQTVIAARQASQAHQVANGSYTAAQQRMAVLGREIRNTTDGFRSQSPELQAKIREYNNLNEGLKRFDATMGNHQRNVGNYTGALNGVIGTLSGLAAGFLSAAALLQMAFSTALKTDAIKTSLEFTFKSVDVAKTKMDALRVTAGRLGLEYTGLADSYRAFAGAAVASNFPMKETDRIFNSVANAGAKMKLTTEQVGGALTALQQMISKGNVQSEELRGQLGERLPGAFAIAARAMGVTQRELGKLLADGKVLAADLLPKLADELDKTFANDKTERVKSLSGAWNRVKNGFTEFVETKGVIGETFTYILDLAGKTTEGFAKLAQAMGVYYDLIVNGKKFIGDSAKVVRNEAFELEKENAAKQAKIAIKNAGNQDSSYNRLKQEAKLLGELDVIYRKLNAEQKLIKPGDRNLADTYKLQDQEKAVRQQKLLVSELKTEYDKLYRVVYRKDAADEDLKSVKAIQARITELKKLDGSAIVGDKIYERIEALQSRLKKPKVENSDAEIKARDTLQRRLDEIAASATLKQLSADEAEVESVRKKYKEMTDEAVKFNNDPKNRKAGVRVDGGKLVKAEKTEIQTVIDKQSNNRLKTQLAAEAKDFEAFEQYKTQYGQKEAEKRFNNQFTTAEAYGQKLENLQTKLLSEITDPADATDSQKQELDIVTDAIKENAEKRKAIDDSTYASAYQAAKTLSQKLEEIESDHQKNLKALRDKGDVSPEQEAILNKAKSKATSTVSVDELTGSDSWSKLFSNMDELATSQIDTLINEIESKFSDLSVKFDPIDLESIRSKLNDAKKIVIERNPFAKVGDTIKAAFSSGADGAKKSVQQIQTDWNNLSSATSGSFKFIDDAIESCDVLKDIIGEVGSSALSTLARISQAGIAVSQAVQLAGTASAAVAVSTSTAIKTAEKASVILAIISAALAVTQAIAGFFKSIFNAHDKRLEKSIKGHKEQVDSLSSAYNRLENDVNRSVGKAVEQAHLRQIDNLKQQQAELEKIRNDEQSKKKPDQGKINDANDQIASIGDKIKDKQDEIIQGLVGTTAKSISDGIIAGFKSGKRTMLDFGDDFRGMMEDSLLKALQTEYLDDAIAGFYKRYAEAAKGGLTDEKVNALKREYESIIQKGLDEMKNIDKITGGPKVDESTGNSLKGAYATASQESITLLAGQTSGMRIAQIETNSLLKPIGKSMGDIYEIAKSNFDIAVKTERNTFKTANNTDRLENIEAQLIQMNRKIGESGNAAKAAGF